GGGLDHRVGALRTDRRSIGVAERHLFRNRVEIGRSGLLGAQLGTDQHCRTDKQCRQNLPSHGYPPKTVVEDHYRTRLRRAVETARASDFIEPGLTPQPAGSAEARSRTCAIGTAIATVLSDDGF